MSWHFDHWDEAVVVEQLRRFETRQWQIDQIFEHLFEALRHN